MAAWSMQTLVTTAEADIMNPILKALRAADPNRYATIMKTTSELIQRECANFFASSANPTTDYLNGKGFNFIYLRTFLSALTSIHIIDASANETALANSEVRFEEDTGYIEIVNPSSVGIFPIGLKNIKAIYTAPLVADVPEQIKEATCLWACDIFDNQEKDRAYDDIDADGVQYRAKRNRPRIPNDVEILLDHFRRHL